DDMSQWPKIDPRDPTYQRDLASLQVRGEHMEGMEHGEGMNHGGPEPHGGTTMNHEHMQHGGQESQGAER
ncbi:MAG TPA: hypothetical protein VFG66_04780, partial [Gemmatimonadales bacterium]|nr:hypothetical protein [Gemmatimonadales bacterium]